MCLIFIVRSDRLTVWCIQCSIFKPFSPSLLPCPYRTCGLWGSLTNKRPTVDEGCTTGFKLSPSPPAMVRMSLPSTSQNSTRIVAGRFMTLRKSCRDWWDGHVHILTYTHTHTHTHSQGLGTENVPWRITTVNQDFSLCETYHTVLGVPRVASDDDLKAVGQFRSKGRIPGEFDWQMGKGCGLNWERLMYFFGYMHNVKILNWKYYYTHS